ncbi:hypothetical protein MAIT1_00384 [Magnetofaba australis IT-1]|uniref:Uncharacterized protein n=1 Tax=Magnetofaba australis IT-1 TaxID=1434232 RepID=A0A1Y2K7Z0_9PROT|nr:hypothetical protein MAIT1_00384 [Magnetofaba australis IT-1]
MKKLPDGSDAAKLDRFVNNYAALRLALEEVMHFAGMEPSQERAVWLSLEGLLKSHLAGTNTIRRESAAILDRMAREVAISRPDERPPFAIEGDQLIVPAKVILDFLNRRGFTFPVTSPNRLTSHLKIDGFLLETGVQKRLGGRKFSSCLAISLKALEEAGVDWPTDNGPEGPFS